MKRPKLIVAQHSMLAGILGYLRKNEPHDLYCANHRLDIAGETMPCLQGPYQIKLHSGPSKCHFTLPPAYALTPLGISMSMLEQESAYPLAET